uniref:Fe2OG dioxygenase domain-containing protein n=1 Tax=viral metagenome TaxID=1070528 RepID=A0A6C0JK87_9ZZZZ
MERQGMAREDSQYNHPKVINDFITIKQNNEILEFAKPRFKDSLIGGGSVHQKDLSVRNSQTAWVSRDNKTAKEIITKVCDMYNLPFENAEDLQVVKYEKGNYYKEHHDSFPYYEPDFLSQGGHRVVTALIYLNDDFEEGETRFVALDKNIKPQKNGAILFHPLDADNKKCHPKALHAGLPIKSGTKYVANVWIREGPFKYDVDRSTYDFYFNDKLLYLHRLLYYTFYRNK